MKKIVQYHIFLFSLIGFQLFAQTPILVENQKLTVVNLGGNSYTLGSNGELSISTPVTSNGTINFTSDSAWLILDGVLPSQAIASHFSYISVNGQPAVNKVNIRVTNYLRGCIIMPHSPTYEALTLYKDADYAGDAMKCIPNKYYKIVDLGSFDNTVSSFKLKKGYMATLAQNENGTGYSKVFIAEKGDLQINTLQVGLNDKVSFVRVFPWRYTDKKGFGSGLPDFNRSVTPVKLTKSGWFYHWGTTSTEDLTDVEFVPMRWNAKSLTDSRWKEILDLNYSNHLLGFNEPDGATQANMTLDEMLLYWPKMMESGMRLGSPAPAGNLQLLYDFIDKCDELNYRVDFVAIHDYGEGTAQAFYNKCKAVHDRTGRPIWITEFNSGGTWTKSTPTYPAIATRIAEIIDRYDTEGIIERYSIFSFDEIVNDSGGVQNRAVFVTPAMPNYTLTPLGIAYRDNVAPMAFNALEEINNPLKLVAPQNLSVSNLNNVTNKLEWDNFNFSGVGSYFIERSFNNAPYTTIAQISTTNSSYDDDITSLGIGSYFYRIATRETGYTTSKFAASFNDEVIIPNVDGFVAQSSGIFNTTLTNAELKKGTGFNREIYLTYDFSAITIAAKSAILKIFCQSFDKFGDLTVSVYCLPEYQTTELSWGTRPTITTAISTLSINQLDHANNWLEFDISSSLATVLATPTKKATYVIKITAGNDALLKFTMSESTSNKPSVVLSVANPINAGVNSKLKMPTLFSNNMVIQRDKPIRIWGQVLPNLPVTITFDGQTYNTTCGANGEFSTLLPAKSASTNSYTLTVFSNNETFSYSNVVMGDVYLCGGQSNMALTVNATQPNQLANATADANYPNLRFFEVAKIVSGGFLLNAPDNPWKSAIPDRIVNWSAVAFFVGRDLHKDINVPIGLINVSHGGAPTDAFISPEAYANDPLLNGAKRADGGGIYSYYTTPSSLYNAMISKVAGYPIKAVLWYQAEANATYWPVYKTMLKGLIKDWRTQFNEPTLPWLFVQLPGFNPGDSTNMTWAEIRDIQLQVSKEDLTTRMAVTIDLGEENDIHPKDKYTVAKRMLPQVKALVYGQQIVHKSPIYKWHEVQGAHLTITFDNVGSGLVSVLTPIEGFEIAGSDKVYKTATATILSNNRITLTNATISNPLYARYAFLNFPTVSIYTSDTLPLPLSPFRTQSLNCNCN